MFNPIEASSNIKKDFISYISTSFGISNIKYAKLFNKALQENNLIVKGPYLDLGDAFETGTNMNSLIEEGVVSPLFKQLEPVAEKDKEIKLERKLYKHQEEAIRKINDGKNLVVTTGTGSGKTECFMLPILNHLLRENENGTLGMGVRAILIYPMNALASDQMKRLRAILKNYPDITFGVYNSSTQQDDASGIAEYKKVFKDAKGNPESPLPNEILSRSKMQETPPNILVTNYSMLEYMMLRPKDDAVFSGAKLRFLVLDEAHIYRGATGIETSLLLKRLKARISNPDNVINILTSATLGGEEENGEIVNFARTLCSSEFSPNDIIRSKTIRPKYDEEEKNIPKEVFKAINDESKTLTSVLEDYKIDYNSNQKPEEILYDLCLSSKIYRTIRESVIEPMTLDAIVDAVQDSNLSKEDIIEVINVAAKASKNKMALIKARYHTFVRALEGAFITLEDNPDLSLVRKEYKGFEPNTLKYFEACQCNECGRMGIVGECNQNKYNIRKSSYDDDLEYYILKEKDEKIINDNNDDIEDRDETLDENLDIGINDYVVCAKCGEIQHLSKRNEFTCNHGDKYKVNLYKTQISSTTKKGKCPCCNIGDIRRFYLGYDAATSVLGTSLFEQLPEKEKVLSTSKAQIDPSNPFLVGPIQEKVEYKTKAKQFLVFSDSRSEAAYYAAYMTKYYQEFLRRRGMLHVLNEMSRDTKWIDIKSFVEELARYFDSNRTFLLPDDSPTANKHTESKYQAWIAVLNELINAKRSTSLTSLGVLKFSYLGIQDNQLIERLSNVYNLPKDDMKALLELLVKDIVDRACVYVNTSECNLSDYDREYIYFTTKPHGFVKEKTTEDTSKKNFYGWIPSKTSKGNYRKSARVTRVMNALNMPEDKAIEFLSLFWEGILTNGEHSLNFDSEIGNYFDASNFMIEPIKDNLKLYRCSKCGKTTSINMNNKCILVKCGGELEELNDNNDFYNNYYISLYSNGKMSPLNIREHTGQLGREEQQKYQQQFVNKRLNALSSSTTFEMGVDVGDLETVYLRNVPPSPSNYVQRAGRTGRSLNTAAFALTYCKLSSHDFTYFNDPKDMISGKIGVPLITIRNEKVIIRHIFAVALSDFFRINPDVYNKNDADIFLNGNGYERLCDYLNSEPNDLKERLKKSIPITMHEIMGINDYSWKEKLIGENGILNIAIMDFKGNIEELEKEIEENKSDSNILSKKLYELQNYRKAKEDHRGKNDLIEFLTRNNVLPKYGFPVDTVELHQSSKEALGKLQMSRDLQLAVSEYAPGAQIVADDRLYTSRYIRKMRGAQGSGWEEYYIAKCTNLACNTWNKILSAPSEDGTVCAACGYMIERNKWFRSIEPRNGFVAEALTKDVPMSKPNKVFKTDDCYIGDAYRKVLSKKAYAIGNHKLQLETSANDALMVVCNSKFHVCSACGYSLGINDSDSSDTTLTYKTKIEKQHQNSNGYKCVNKDLYQTRLSHIFKTDVVNIKFNSIEAKSDTIMYSVMYALLDAISEMLNIERTDIKGCLAKTNVNGMWTNSIVLYDAVAGGAGHVTRLTLDDGQTFSKVVNKAIENTINCDCSPSCYKCLRNYYNQGVHEILDRKLVYKFLQKYQGTVEPISNEEFAQRIIEPKENYSQDEISINKGDQIDNMDLWENVIKYSPEELVDILLHLAVKQVRTPDDMGSDIYLKEEKIHKHAIFAWYEEKVLLFTTDEKIQIDGWNCFDCYSNHNEIANIISGII